MKRGAGNHLQNNNTAKRQRTAEDNSSAQTVPEKNVFSQITQALYRAGSWFFGKEIENNGGKKVRADETLIKRSEPPSNAPQSLISFPLDVLAIIMAHGTPKDMAFSPNTNAVCRQFQKATDRLRFMQYSKKNGPDQPPVDGHKKNPSIEKQEKEISYFLENEAAILGKTRHLPIVIACFNRLKSAGSALDDTRRFFAREEILNRLNTTIFESRIRISQAGNPIRLDCSNCHITRLPGKLFKLSQYRAYWAALQKLDLDNNQLQSLPPEIAQLTALQGFFLVNNQLQSLPPEIGQLTALLWLHLCNNQLQNLPPEIGQLAKLQWLSLENNALQILPDNLREGVLRDNDLNKTTKAQVLALQRKSSSPHEEEPKRLLRPS